MQVENLTKLVEKLRARVAQTLEDSELNCVVGFTQKYAVYVHENLEAHHPVGQAKFLEQPARELAPELGRMIVENLKRRRSMSQALLLAGLRLQREAQLLCPVDTGALKGSAFTKLEKA